MSGATETAAAGIALSQSAAPTTLTAGGVAQLIAVFFVAMGLQPEHLFAGMWGALAGILLLGNVPLQRDTILGRVNQAFERFVLVIVSAVMAGYTTPFLGNVVAALVSVIPGISSMDVAEIKGTAQMFTAFAVGAGSRQLLQKIIRRYARAIDSAAATPSTTGQH